MSQLGRTRFLAVSQMLYLRGGEILEGRLWCSAVFGFKGVNVWLLTCVHMNGCRNKLGYAYLVLLCWRRVMAAPPRHRAHPCCLVLFLSRMPHFKRRNGLAEEMVIPSPGLRKESSPGKPPVLWRSGVQKAGLFAEGREVTWSSRRPGPVQSEPWDNYSFWLGHLSPADANKQMNKYENRRKDSALTVDFQLILNLEEIRG